MLRVVGQFKPMADGAVQIIEVRTGSSARSMLELSPGAQLQPMSVGRSAAWSIDAPGVLPVHAYFYFDGQGLFVQSSDERNPAKSNGRPIGSTWQQIESPSTLEIGGARLVFRTVEDLDLDEAEEEDDERTIAREALVSPQMRAALQAQARPPMPAQPVAAPPNPAGLGEPEPTIVAPLHADEARPGQGRPRPAAGLPAAAPKFSPAGDRAPESHTISGPAPLPPRVPAYQAFGSVQLAAGDEMPQAHRPMNQTLQPWGATAPGAPLETASAPHHLPQQTQMSLRAAGETSLLARMKKDWTDTSLPKKVMFLLMPVLLAVLVAGQHRKEQIAADEAIEARRAQASASASAVAAKPDPTAAATAAATQTAAAYVPPVASAVASASATAKGAPPPKSMERQAADALASNDYRAAAAAYEQLAATTPPQDPRHETYAEAARILGLKSVRP
jgi:hypothetical protein